jgi:hypothetical protein
MPSPITSSPLSVKVSKDGTTVTATDPDGNVVLESQRPIGDNTAPPAVHATAAGTWTIGWRNEAGNTAVTDAAGVPVAELRGHPFVALTIATGDGTEIHPVTGPFLTRYGVKFGQLAEASATYLLQKRDGFKLKLSDELLARRDCEMLVAVFVHLGRVYIARQRAAARQNSGGGPSGPPP